MHFERDGTKAAANAKKHGVTFPEAETVLFDPNALLYHDPDHSNDEQRFLLLGPSIRSLLLIVAHCLRQDGNSIRIISARKATRSEHRAYLAARRS